MWDGANGQFAEAVFGADCVGVPGSSWLLVYLLRIHRGSTGGVGRTRAELRTCMGYLLLHRQQPSPSPGHRTPILAPPPLGLACPHFTGFLAPQSLAQRAASALNKESNSPLQPPRITATYPQSPTPSLIQPLFAFFPHPGWSARKDSNSEPGLATVEAHLRPSNGQRISDTPFGPIVEGAAEHIKR